MRSPSPALNNPQKPPHEQLAFPAFRAALLGTDASHCLAHYIVSMLDEFSFRHAGKIQAECLCGVCGGFGFGNRAAARSIVARDFVNNSRWAVTWLQRCTNGSSAEVIEAPTLPSGNAFAPAFSAMCCHKRLFNIMFNIWRALL
jgi:hypothetical protein